jgi:hypothetical protein
MAHAVIKRSDAKSILGSYLWIGEINGVPVAVDCVWLDAESLHLGIGDLDGLRVAVGVDVAADKEIACCRAAATSVERSRR